MRRPSIGIGMSVVATLGLVAAGRVAAGRVVMPSELPAPNFELNGKAIGGATPATTAAPAYLAGARIAATIDGALVIDEDSGDLVLTVHDGVRAHLPIGRGAGVLAYDALAGRAYVADRRGDRIVAVAVGDDLKLAASWPVAAEPFGVALSPDRTTLLVTTIASRELVALDTATGHERWHVALGPEPRGVAIAPDGSRALVAHLTGLVDSVTLANHAWTAFGLDTTLHATNRNPPRPAFARAAFTVGFVGAHEAVVPFEREVPVQTVGRAPVRSGYGGGEGPPITEHLAFVDVSAGDHSVNAEIAQSQPRAVAWDSAHDELYVVGIGSETVLQLRGASTAEIHLGSVAALTAPDSEACGPDGLAIAPGGGVLVWCAMSRRIVDLARTDVGNLDAQTPSVALTASAMTPAEHTGFVTFHQASTAVSLGGRIACANCHPEGRADGLSWQIESHRLQTPILAGRVTDTAPYKWDGSDPDLASSVRSTMRRLGGFGLDNGDTDAVTAYLESLPAPRTPPHAAAAVERGKAVFDGAGCQGCHDGAMLTDRDRHALRGTLAEVDTPSLHGLAASAPYFHDGSAATLDLLLRDKGAVHGMADTTKLTAAQRADLVAYLETL